MQPGDVGLQAAFDDAHDLRRNPNPDTLYGLVTAYLGSSDFRSKGASTRRHYQEYLDMIRAQFGTLSLSDLEALGTRCRFKAWRDSMADTPRKADYA